MKKIIVIILGMATAIILMSCTNETPTNPEAPTHLEAPTHPLVSDIGKGCTVQFKRNALGSARDLPVPPTTTAINNAGVTLAGTLKAVREDGILVEGERENYWIPMDAILLIHLRK